MKTTRLVLVGFASLSLTAQVISADIVALCIGNDAYHKPEDVLDTPVADARLIKQALEALPGGADVKLLTDASRVDIVIALNELKDRARGAKLALVFYSGHGMDGQPRGYQNEDTFLLPVEAQIPNEDHLAASAVGLREVLAALKDCPVTARAVILDCCRTGAPKATGALVAGGTKNFGQLDERVKVALGKAIVPEATLVAFAASPGRKAAAFLSEQDANSPFTAFLAAQLGSGAGNLRDLVEAAAEQTELATERRQVPYVSYSGATSAIRQIVFRTASTPGAPPTAPAAMVRTNPALAPTFPGSRGMDGIRGGEVREFGGIDLVWCPPGEFLMGSPSGEAGRYDDETQHRVMLTRGFWLAKTETTQGQWTSAMGSTIREMAKQNPHGTDLHGEGNEHPMYYVSWDDAQKFLAKLNTDHPLSSGWKWSLPTEAQWEYACRAGTETAFAGELDEMAWYSENSGSKTNPVGTKKANAWGLHDMHGNVVEWCADGYGDYETVSANDPRDDEVGSLRGLRGGGWGNNAAYCRSGMHNRNIPAGRFALIGFRPAAVPASR